MRNMNKKEVFYQDREACRVPPAHIMEGVTESPLREIDELFGAADTLSVQNAVKHRRILMALSAAGTLLTLFFLLYDEAEAHRLIIACGVMILCLYFIRRFAERRDCHRKYLEYRVLAECLRCQFYLLYAGSAARVVEILPWSVRMGIPWVVEVLDEIPQESAPTGMDPAGTVRNERTTGKRLIADCWIRDQKKYHESALKKTEIKNGRDSRIAKTVLAVTIAAYIAALLYELFLYRNIVGGGNAELVRTILKILLGTMSAITLFTGSYYGKMSLSDEIDDHKRMIALYEKSEEEILEKGESEELLLFLAREFLNENSTWYAYQSKNSPAVTL